MATFLFVHGAWHGAWCWYRVLPRLESAGHRAIAIDLPGLGRDRTPLPEVTLDLWADAVGRAIDAAGEPVVLVGHSRGGLVISAAAERHPQGIRSLTYLTAYLLKDGDTLLARAGDDTESDVVSNVVFSPDQTSTTFRPEALKDVLYADCSDEDVALARLSLVPEPVKPLATPLRLTEERWGSIPRDYVVCTKDRTIGPKFQRRMAAEGACRRILTLDAGHSPFFSAPDALVKQLVSIATD